MKKLKIALLASMLGLGACTEKYVFEPNHDLPKMPNDKEFFATVDLGNKHQKIESFMASDCWAGNWVGSYWDESQKSEIAELLFSQEIDGKYPKGIGLSGWRFNLGAGTTAQGDESGIEDPTRRSESFLSNGVKDWNKAMGQQYFLRKAKEYGVNDFVMFSISPDVSFTKNGMGYSPGGENINLADGKLPEFVNYISEVITHFKNEGIDFKYLSPINEPQYAWDTKSQEGTPATNTDIYNLVSALDQSFTENNINTKLLVGEAATWEYLYKVKGNENSSNQIETLFGNDSEISIKNLHHVAPIITAHSYWIDKTAAQMRETRTAAYQKASQHGLSLFQTEYSLLGEGFEDHPGHESASYNDVALQVAKVIHHDLNYANVESWSFWTALDQERWGHKNRFLLISVTPSDGAYGNIMNSGENSATKSLWALGNFSRFVRPGFERVDIEIDGNTNILSSAFVSPSSDELVVVYTNLTDQYTGVEIKMDNNMRAVESYVTSNEFDLVKEEINEDERKIQLLPRSVTTVIYK
ncbi:beta-glycosidase [Flammeovirga sp. MY04]|uniref:glycoside hydrolase n=1 Tax=Flammeovirga sp. MY04 TaxID=1191459 RepID=UPI0008260164|nr:glycoside hydrolase [Flammeovirga sp. MY04]ANQ51655.2 beta-glycosidase [Flammeovirga sp. MY04]